ncbi:hypothetical protein DY000_02054156 [Brassica cretica]|uniref:Uncharacterized protein n=1 Tax=Brassica cretica TaxID=69181 RepID=A0ABQ7ABB7_BRACR|nr:hypothetical protein DY000_02054156 [Brassica cretica]
MSSNRSRYGSDPILPQPKWIMNRLMQPPFDQQHWLIPERLPGSVLKGLEDDPHDGTLGFKASLYYMLQYIVMSNSLLGFVAEKASSLFLLGLLLLWCFGAVDSRLLRSRLEPSSGECLGDPLLVAHVFMAFVVALFEKKILKLSIALNSISFMNTICGCSGFNSY